MSDAEPPRRGSPLAVIGPGLLVAATGVGAGDLATGAFAGGKLGLAVLWAVLVGALLKFVLTEGIARWQLATGRTALDGCVTHFGPVVTWCFLLYLVLWSFFVGSALISASGVAAHALVPLYAPSTDKVLYGLLHSAVAVVLVRIGGYRLFAAVMSACIAVMFVVAVFSAVAMRPSWPDVALGLCVPRIPRLDGQGLGWTVALLGGVGGTVTILCYGYWIREEGRSGPDKLGVTRVDLAAGYVMTALFGVAMVVIGHRVGPVSGRGADLLVKVADGVEQSLGRLGPVARWAFLIGAWSAIFSSLLGVWQSVPYLFTDLRRLMGRREPTADDGVVSTGSRTYRLYLYAIAIVPALALWLSFEQVQKIYAIVGALFIPMLALALLVLNGRPRLVGPRHRNGWFTTVLLVAAVALFALLGWFEVRRKLGL